MKETVIELDLGSARARSFLHISANYTTKEASVAADCTETSSKTSIQFIFVHSSREPVLPFVQFYLCKVLNVFIMLGLGEVSIT